MFMYTHQFSCAYRFSPDPFTVPVFGRRLHVQLDEIGLPRVTVEAGGALDVNPENRWQPVKEGSVNREVSLRGIEPTEFQIADRSFDFIRVA